MLHEPRAGGEAKKAAMLAFLALKAVLGRPLMLQYAVETRIPTIVGKVLPRRK